MIMGGGRWLLIFPVSLILSLPALATDLILESFVPAKGLVKVHEPLSITATIRNKGSDPVQGVIVRLEIKGKAWGPDYSINMAPNALMGVSWTVAFSAGHNEMWLKVDPDNVVSESDESNNKDVRTIFAEALEIPPATAGPLLQEANRGQVGMLPLQPMVFQAVKGLIKADLYPRNTGFFTTSSAHYGVSIRNKGPNTVPESVLELLSVHLLFIGAPTDQSCVLHLKGKNLQPLLPNSELNLNFYTDSAAPCPRALLPIKPRQPKNLAFKEALFPESRLSLLIPNPSAVISQSSYSFSDPMPNNNVFLVSAN